MRTRPAVVALALACMLAGCGGGDGGGDTAAGTATTVGGERPSPEPPVQGDADAGRRVFVDAGCGGCHTLDAAGTRATTGPNLDEQELDYSEIVEQIEDGGDGMPAFRGRLSETQINNVAAFVAESTQD